jgi:hypothetical protein
MYKTQPHTKTKIFFLLILAFLIIFAVCVDVPVSAAPDLSTSVLQIVNDQTLSPLEKNTAQAELFGWTESLGLYLTETLITEQPGEPDLITKVLRTVGIAASPLPPAEGEAAWTDYLATYVANYQGSYTYK